MSSEVKKITIIISSENHPVNSMISDWISRQPKNYVINIVRTVEEVSEGDLLFFFFFTDLRPINVLQK